MCQERAVHSHRSVLARTLHSNLANRRARARHTDASRTKVLTMRSPVLWILVTGTIVSVTVADADARCHRRRRGRCHASSGYSCCHPSVMPPSCCGAAGCRMPRIAGWGTERACAVPSPTTGRQPGMHPEPSSDSDAPPPPAPEEVDRSSPGQGAPASSANATAPARESSADRSARAPAAAPSNNGHGNASVESAPDVGASATGRGTEPANSTDPGPDRNTANTP